MTAIEWSDETWNPVIGCRRVSRGCEQCYAETQAKRIVAMERGRGERSPYEDVVKWRPATADELAAEALAPAFVPIPKWNGRAVFLPERLYQPLRWTKPRRIFVNSMSDLFHEDLSFEQIAAVFGVMAATPRHTYQVLTKRPVRALEFFEWVSEEARGAHEQGFVAEMAPCAVVQTYALYDFTDGMELRATSRIDRGSSWPLPNVWLGVSCEDQATADERIPLLLRCPAAVRFVSAEPLLGPIDFLGRLNHFKAYKEAETVTHIEQLPGGRPFGVPRKGRGWVHYTGAYPDWVIVGGESGPGARPCDVAQIRSIVEQCRDAGVPVFVKQLGAQPHGAQLDDRKGGDPDEWPEDLRVRQFPQTQQEPEQ